MPDLAAGNSFTHERVAQKHAISKLGLQPWLVVGFAFVAAFLAMGLLLIPLLGFQTDEVMFVRGLWLPKTGVAWFSFFHHYMPSMLMSYLGGLKSWLYAPLLSVVSPSVWTVRLPVLLLAALTIVLVGRLLFTLDGRVAAVVGVALLASDNTLLLTSVFDWGPVVLQNLLLVSCLLAYLRWYRRGNAGMLCLAGLLTGLALWNKALFLWNLSALAVALVVFAHRQTRRVLHVKWLAVLLLGTLLGAYPLLRYNLKNHGATMAQNAKLRWADVVPKAAMWRQTLDGQAARVALIAPEIAAPDHIERPWQQAAAQVGEAAGPTFSTWGFAIGSCLLATGLCVGSPRQRRTIGFFLCSCLLAWLQSALTIHAGGSIHHTCLFLVQWYCAVALAAAAVMSMKRIVVTGAALALVLVLCLRSLVAMDLMYANLIAFESHSAWTNAEQPFVESMLRSGVKRVITADWGLSDVVTTRSVNRILVDQQAFDLGQSQFHEPLFLACQAPDCVVAGHVQPRASMPQDQLFLKAQLARLGVVQDETVFLDSHGQPVITLSRIHPPMTGSVPPSVP